MSTYSFAALKASARRVVHDTLGVDATYLDDTMNGSPEDVRVRWKTKGREYGDLLDSGYAQVVEAIDRIVLIPSDTPDITFRVGGVITIPEWGVAFNLDTLEQSTGPLTATWQVSKV